VTSNYFQRTSSYAVVIYTLDIPGTESSAGGACGGLQSIFTNGDADVNLGTFTGDILRLSLSFTQYL